MENTLQRIRQTNELKADKALADARHKQRLDADFKTQEIILKAFRSLVTYLDSPSRVTKTTVVNQLEEIKTPDALKVAEAVNDLHTTVKNKKDVDLSEIASLLKSVLAQTEQLPKSHKDIVIPDTVTVKNQVDHSKDFAKLEKAVKAIKLVVEAPVVNVPAPEVTVETDLKPLSKDMKAVEKAVNSLVFPEYKTDNKEVEKLLKKSNKLLDEIASKPVGNGGGGRATPYQLSEGQPHFVEVEADGSIPVTVKNPDDIGGGTTAINYLIKNISPSDDPEIATYKYFGYVESGGTNWRIMRKTIADNSFDYATGTSGYTTAWTNRASGSYS